MSRRTLGSLAAHVNINENMNESSSQPKSLHDYSMHDSLELPISPVQSSSSYPYPPGASSSSSSSLISPPPRHVSPPRVLARGSSSSRLSPLFLANTTPRDRKIILKSAQIDEIRRTRTIGLVGSGGGERKRYFWKSPFIHKEKRVRMLLILHSSVFPVLSRHLAARMIQHWWHRFTPEERRKRSTRKHAAAAAKGLVWRHPYVQWKEVASQASRLPRRRMPTLAAGYFLETGQYATQIGTGGAPGSKSYTHGYRDWCAGKIARSWLYWRQSRRYRSYMIRPVYSYAAVDIQRCFREYIRKKSERGDPTLPLHSPARVIQRAYRRFTQRRIYQYFRDLILSRQNSNPYLLLKMLQPREALSANDHASGLYLRFRLGGNVFPPILYYKTFTSFNITDINSFAPRDYARDRKLEKEKIHIREGDNNSNNDLHSSQSNPTDRAYWYRRYENNGWRPIVNDILLEQRDVVNERTSSKMVTFHPNKLVRKMEVLKRRKEKKIEWLKKLYTSGVVTLPTTNTMSGEQTNTNVGDGSMYRAGVDPDRELDSDEEEWEAWKMSSASQAKLGGGGGIGLGDDGSKDPSDILARLSRVDLTNTRTLLSGECIDDGGDSLGWEDEANELLEWTNGLGDFEAYHDSWLVTATSRPNDKNYRLHDFTRTDGGGAGGTKKKNGVQGGVNSTDLNGSPSASHVAGGAPAVVGAPLAHSVTLAPSASARLREIHESAFESYDPSDGGLAMEVAALQAEAEEENEGLPAWVAQTASRAQIAQLQQQHQHQSQRSLAASASRRQVSQDSIHSIGTGTGSSSSVGLIGGGVGSRTSLRMPNIGSRRSLASSSSLGMVNGIDPSSTIQHVKLTSALEQQQQPIPAKLRR